MSVDPSGPRGHKRSASSDLMESVDIRKLERDLKSIEATLLERHMNVSVLLPAVETVEEVLKSLQFFDEYEKEARNIGRTISAFSFSDLEEKHLHKLGVLEDPEGPIPSEAVTRTVSEFMQQGNRYHPIGEFWKEHSVRLSESFRSIDRTTSLVTEAGSRILIDRIVQEVIEFLVSKDMFPYVFPELKLSNAKQRPAEIRTTINDTQNQEGKKHYSTFLTGSVDYFVIATRSTLITGHIREELTRDMKTAYVANSLASLADVAGPLEQNNPDPADNLGHLQIVHVEAKRKNETKVLRQHRTQAIGETLVTMSTLKKDRGMWCLTTGKEWIFGLIKGDLSNEGDQRISYSTESLAINFDSPTFERQLKDVFFTLVFFFLGPPEDIESLYHAS